MERRAHSRDRSAPSSVANPAPESGTSNLDIRFLAGQELGSQGVVLPRVCASGTTIPYQIQQYRSAAEAGRLALRKAAVTSKAPVGVPLPLRSPAVAARLTTGELTPACELRFPLVLIA